MPIQTNQALVMVRMGVKGLEGWLITDAHVACVVTVF